MALTSAQREKATELLAARPPVIPGTRVIIDDKARKEWFNRVTTAMSSIELADSDVNQFCDIAGVPD